MQLALCLLAVAIIVGSTGYHLRVSYVLTVEAGVTRYPANDNQLEQWLKEQPGVVPNTVHIKRRDNGKLEILMIQSRSPLGFPAFPDLDGACERFGYELKSRFQFVRGHRD